MILKYARQRSILHTKQKQSCRRIDSFSINILTANQIINVFNERTESTIRCTCVNLCKFSRFSAVQLAKQRRSWKSACQCCLWVYVNFVWRLQRFLAYFARTIFFLIDTAKMNFKRLVLKWANFTVGTPTGVKLSGQSCLPFSKGEKIALIVGLAHVSLHFRGIIGSSIHVGHFYYRRYKNSFS